MHHVTRFDPAELAEPQLCAGHAEGYGRASHIDREAGAIHTGMGTCELAPGGRLDPHVHSYEEFLYVTEGRLEATIDGDTIVLEPNQSAFVAVGANHELRNAGSGPCRWIDLVTPQPRDARGPADTFFVPSLRREGTAPLDIRDPRARRFDSWSHAQMDLDALKEPVPSDAPAVSASMSSALLAYAGITVKMLLDERHGAHLGNLFMVDYYPSVVLQPHDHPFEEAFYMLEGEVRYFADGEEYALLPGDVAYAGVGCIHWFENPTAERCRWLESRAPQPPLHHGYRFNRDWEHLETKLAGGAS